MSTKRTRGSYSSLICLRCRSRKIRCILEDPESLLPSTDPLPPDRACQRCKQNGFDCILDFTILGRPSGQSKRSCLPSVINAQRGGPSSQVQAESFMIPQTDATAEHDPKQPITRPSNRELCEAMLSPALLMTSLLSLDSQFGFNLDQPHYKALLSLQDVLLQCDLSQVDQGLVWVRFYLPQLPTLAHICAKLDSNKATSITSSALYFLAATMLLLASDAPNTSLTLTSSQRRSLQSIAFEHGQEILMNPGQERYAILGLLLATKYLPMAVTSHRRNALASLKGLTQLSAARRAAMRLGLDSAYIRLRDLSNKDLPSLTNDVLDCLLWVQLVLDEADADRNLDAPTPSPSDMGPTISESLLYTRKVIEDNNMAVAIIHNYILCQIRVEGCAINKRIEAVRSDLQTLDSLLSEYDQLCNDLRAFVNTQAAKLQDDNHKTILVQLTRQMIHRQQIYVSGHAMFAAVLSAANHHRAQIKLDELVRIGDNVIDVLKEKPTPQSSPTLTVRGFLEKRGTDRMDRLPQILTDFIHSAQLTLDGHKHFPPARMIPAVLLFACKAIVENNAARFKGWGGLHEHTDTWLVLFESCATTLEAMSRSSTAPSALADGNLFVACAKMIRSLASLMAGWKHKLTLGAAATPTAADRKDALYGEDDEMGVYLGWFDDIITSQEWW